MDQYQLCPCGNGKKIKFCDCSRDIVQELEKIVRSIEGDQRVAALDQIKKVIADKGSRRCLLALKGDLELGLGQLEDAKKTVVEFQKSAPYNPVSLALAAIIAVSEGDVEEAVERLQRAIEYIDATMPPSVYAAIGTVGRALIASGEVLAARGHWLMQASLAGDRDEEPAKLLARVNASPELPLLLKEDYFFAECPTDAPWAGEFNAAMTSARRGAWLAACESLDSLAEKVPGEQAIFKNIAIFRSWLGQTSQAIRAWQSYAALEDVAHDDAIEAEALAQLIDPDLNALDLDEVTVTYTVSDTERMMELLLSSKRVSPMPIDPSDVVEEGEPPPKGVFWLLDRDVVEEGAELAREDIPCVLGELYLFGRQTDRDARLEFVVERTDEFEQNKSALLDMAGSLLGDSPSEEKTGATSSFSEALTWRWRLPNNMPRQRRQELLDEQQRDTMLNVWPEVEVPALGGKRPIDVANDPGYRVRLEAAILLLQLGAENASRRFDFNELREKLGLETVTLRPIGDHGIRQLSVMKIANLDPSDLSDEQLVHAFQIAVVKRLTHATYRFAKELLNRDSIASRIERDHVYEAVINTCSDPDQALQFVDEARKSAIADNKSPAKWLLTELSIRLPRLETEKCNELLGTLRSRHLNEPGIGESLYQLLVSYGIISPDGKPATTGRGGDASVLTSEEPASEPAKIWTPDGGGAASGDPKKTNLWVPGD